MNLRSAYPYWLLNQGIIKTYPSLPADTKTEVLIMGAGISGALAAWYLCKAGIKVIVVDKRHVGMGSTAASTALIQYEIDTPLIELKKKIGEEHAIKSYQLCVQSIFELEKICGKLNADTGFKKRPSFQFASFKKDLENMEKEYEARKKIGISLQWLDASGIEKKFGFRKDAGLLSRDGAELDAYAFTHAILDHCRKVNGLEVYDHTEIKAIHHHKKEIQLVTAENKKLRARKLVIACGYESRRYLPRRQEQFHSTYAIISEPFSGADFWYRRAIIWETDTPYLYLRTTKDNRILVGGKDDDFSDGHRREGALPQKVKALEKAFAKLFPQRNFKTDFAWAGVFASTPDGLPYIGAIPQRPDTYFALGFGGNGITFSVLAGQIIRDQIIGKSNPDAGIFHFNR
jgi:glycine/D-amino acid oxidase-like deaminating enzyme